MRTVRTASIVVLATLAAGVALALPVQEPVTLLENSFDVGGEPMLEVEVHDADVVLRNGPAGRIDVAVVMTADDETAGRERVERMNFRATLEGDRVIVRSDRQQGWSWNWRRDGRFNVRVEVTAPERLDVEVETQDGDVSAERIDGDVRLTSQDGDILADSLSGAIDVRTQDGDVRVSRVRGSRVSLVSQDGDLVVQDVIADSLVLETADGDIVVEAAQAPRTEATTSDGDITLAHVRGGVGARTSDGDLRVDFDEAGDSDLATHDGDIVLSLPEAAAVRLDLRGERTSLRAPESFDGSVTRRRIEGDLNGGGPAIAAQTRDGSVALRLR